MPRNTESRFALNPTNIDLTRSKFKRPSGLKTSFNVGDIIPIYVDEVLPGDTFDLKTNKVVRLQTPVTPFFDNIYMDTYFFFVPNRLVWEHWKQFMGENTESAWIPTADYEIPQISAPSGGWNVGTIADYLTVPTGVDNISVSALPFRAYALIMNEWFRDENLLDPLVIPVDDTTVTGVNTGTYVTDCVKGGLPYKAAKFHDYFTSCLPSPQKGPDVKLPVVSGYTPVDSIPVYGSGKALSFYDGTNVLGFGSDNGNDPYYNAGYFGVDVGGSLGTSGAGLPYVKAVGVAPKSVVTDPEDSGLVADTSLLNFGINVGTINQLRLAFQIQKLYEKDARGGSRYIEILKSHFGVTSPDYRLQRPEYLGGNRCAINVNQVVQQSATGSGSTPQGNVAAMSVTTDSHHDFTKSFTEHGLIIGVAVARYDHTYQQGLDRMWSRKDRFDYYWPVLANIGEQAVLNKELMLQGTSDDNEVFGYQEAWADYRYKPNKVTGEMRSSYATSLDVWHLADDYATLPTLSEGWILEDKTNVDRVLAVKSSVSNQLFGDFFFDVKTTRPMPVYSIPGLIDHH